MNNNGSRTAIADLQAFLLDNAEFERLESILAEFNIFEVLDAVNAEVRHSEFLAYLLNPQQNHGLNDSFIRRLLQAILFEIPADLQVIRPLDLELMDLDDLEVRREWQSIDILLISTRNKLVVTIENKIHSGEHSNQLQRYRQYIERTYPNWKAIFLFLTPEGDSPAGDESYLPVSYRLVADVLTRLVHTRQSALGSEFLMLVNHYVQMLRRYLVNDEIAELCRQIYRKHKKAIDLIVENIPSRQAAFKEIIDRLIHETDGVLLPDYSRVSEVGFSPADWDVPVLLQGRGWSANNRILLFYFENRPDRLRLMLTIGPGEKEIRQQLLTMAHANKHVFRSASKVLNMKWNNIYSQVFLEQKDLNDLEFDDLEAKIKAAWQKFLKTDYQQIDHILKEQDWIFDYKSRNESMNV